MIILYKLFVFVFILFGYIQINANAGSAPVKLRTDLLLHTDCVWANGYQVGIPLATAANETGKYQFANIQSRNPIFSWELPTDDNFIFQTDYQVRVASSPKLLEDQKPDLWDSGKVKSNSPLNILYKGEALQPNTVYYWQARIWNNAEESEWSSAKTFITAQKLDAEYGVSHYPIQKTDENSVAVLENKTENAMLYCIDFGRAAFGTLRFTLTAKSDIDENQTVTIRLGESVKPDKDSEQLFRVNNKPGGTIRYAEYTLKLQPGTHTYRIQIRPDKRNTGSQAIKMPSYIGEVFPFRYCEIEGSKAITALPSITRESVTYLCDETGFFQSDNEILNKIWELCRYSIKMTSFAGVYVDGDRERIPYEADALINQLSHYAMDNEYSLARVSSEYLITHATWPTEWILQSVLIAWNDYLYTGDDRSLRAFYNDLKAKTLIPLADEKSYLISTKTGKQTSELIRSIHYNTGKEIRDIVDWPQSGTFGQKKTQAGESDFFEFKTYNAVVNAYHYQALSLMAKIARTLQEKDDAEFYSARAAQVKESFNTHFFNEKAGNYRDGIGTDHSAIHSCMFPMAFGMVSEKNIESVLAFIRSRGMACSVYGSQFLLDAIYDAEDANYGLERLTTTDDRSWYNMIRLGSTVTLEAWDNKYKQNLDWNHAWGAAPANIIMRKLVGVEPLTPGWEHIRIKPQPASLQWFKASVPSIRGNICIEMQTNTTDPAQVDKNFSINIPNGIIADLWIPIQSGKNLNMIMNDEKIDYTESNNFAIIENVEPGLKNIKTCIKQLKQ